MTQSTLATVKDFLGLSYDRAYKRFYPPLDPLSSWSRYLTQLSSWFAKNVAPDWIDRVLAMLELLRRGNDVAQMMQVTGEASISLSHEESHICRQYDQGGMFNETDPPARYALRFSGNRSRCRPYSGGVSFA